MGFILSDGYGTPVEPVSYLARSCDQLRILLAAVADDYHVSTGRKSLFNLPWCIKPSAGDEGNGLRTLGFSHLYAVAARVYR